MRDLPALFIIMGKAIKNQKIIVGVLVVAFIILAVVVSSPEFAIGFVGQQDVHLVVEQFYENGQNYAQVSVLVKNPYAERSYSGEMYGWIVFKNQNLLMSGRAEGVTNVQLTMYNKTIPVDKGDVFILYAQRVNQYDVYYRTCTDCNGYRVGCDAGFVQEWRDFVTCANEPYNLGYAPIPDYVKCGGCAPPYAYEKAEITNLFTSAENKEIPIEKVYIYAGVWESIKIYFSNLWAKITGKI